MELRNRSSYVVSFAQYRREHPQHVHRPTDKPDKAGGVRRSYGDDVYVDEHEKQTADSECRSVVRS